MSDDTQKPPTDVINIDDIIGAPKTASAPAETKPLPAVEPIARPISYPSEMTQSRSNRSRSQGSSRSPRASFSGGNNRGNGRYSRGRNTDMGNEMAPEIGEYNPNRNVDPNRAIDFGGEVDGRIIPDAGVA